MANFCGLHVHIPARAFLRRLGRKVSGRPTPVHDFGNAYDFEYDMPPGVSVTIRSRDIQVTSNHPV